MTSLYNNKTLYIVRGCSGSGKSTFASLLGQSLNCTVHETDNYWYMEDGNTYQFDADKIGAAHRWNDYNMVCDMRAGLPNIIVANTCTSEKEVQHHVDMANQFGYSVVSLVVEHRHNGENQHGLSVGKLQAQSNKLRNSLKLI